MAAPQIGIYWRVVIVALGNERTDKRKAAPPIALINPQIIDADDEQDDMDGCLSFPGLYGWTTRPHHLRINGLNEEGEPLEQVFGGFDAVVVHHEIDHLDGVLFIDRIEKPEDLYHISTDANGELVSLPLTFAF